MKNYASVLLAVLLLLTSLVLPVSAARPGDIAGKYYSTDIVTTLNGAEINAINIGGQTLISAEDMRYFGHSVVWNGEDRTLRITETTAEVKNPPKVSRYTKPSGSVLGNYYVTDIVTYLEGKPITAYNIGGWTYIHAEAMREWDYIVNWFGDTRRLEITSPKPAGYVYRIPLSQGTEKAERDTAAGAFSVSYTKDGITGRGDADFFDLSMQANGGKYIFTMAFYQYSGLFCSDALMKILDPLVSESYDGSVARDPASLYDKIGQVLNITVNGRRAEQISIRTGAGNGHRDYIIVVSDLPVCAENTLTEVTVTLGTPTGKSYPLNPEY